MRRGWRLLALLLALAVVVAVGLGFITVWGEPRGGGAVSSGGMAYIDTVSPDDADGPVGREYDAALRRAGRVWRIVAVQSNNPAALRDGLRLYRTVMFGESPLTRAQREMMAVVTSAVNDCHY